VWSHSEAGIWMRATETGNEIIAALWAHVTLVGRYLAFILSLIRWKEDL